MPEVIKRRRTKGWTMPANTVYVGRAGKWGNPFFTAKSYRAWLAEGTYDLPDLLYPNMAFALEAKRDRILRDLPELTGLNLADWCIDWDGQGEPPGVCHAEVLLELANRAP